MPFRKIFELKPAKFFLLHGSPLNKSGVFFLRMIGSFNIKVYERKQLEME